MKGVRVFIFLFIVTVHLYGQQRPAYAPDQLIIKFNDPLDKKSKESLDYGRVGISQMDSLNSRHRCYRLKPLRQATNQNARGRSSAAPYNLQYILYFDDPASIPELVNIYQATGLFEYVEPNYAGFGAGLMEEAIFPNDQHFERQWYIRNDGTFSLSPAKVDADIDLDEAWEIQQGNPSVIVAILDSGIKLDHPEFEGRLWVNSGEQNNNNVDDDGNGHADDVHGWNFVDDTNNITDDNRHGSHVTGVIAATGNNAIGYAGVDWNCKLMICKVLNSQLSGYYSDWIEAIYYAVDQGARVINMSLGGDTFSNSLKDAVEYAHDNGVVIVTSMQNDNTDKVYYPAAFEQTIAVGSSDPDDNRSTSFVKDPSSGSNFGPHIDVVAPGNYIYGLNHLNNSYNALFGGTSLATPVVTGIVSLLVAQNPMRTANEIKSIIQSSSEDMVGDPKEDTPGWDRYYGFGRVNAHLALTEENPDIIGAISISPIPTDGELLVRYTLEGTSFLKIYLTFPDGRRIEIKFVDECRTFEWRFNLNYLPAGIYLLTLESKFGYTTKRIVVIH